MNYNRNSGSPIKKGKLGDIVKPKKRLFSKRSHQDTARETIELKVDLVKVLTDLGIVLSNTHSIANNLVGMGWTKIIKIERDTK